ncbi:penicillin-binding protein 1C [soil metagenome]
MTRASKLLKVHPLFSAAAVFAVAWAIGFAFRSPLLEAFTYSRQVYDRDGHLLRVTLSGDEKYRVFTALEEMPATFKEAVLLHEDRHFYFHPGVNPWSLFKAAAHTYGGGTRRIGGSTITMQLARMTSTRGSKTIAGKVAQIFRALSLELFHSKAEIFEAYLNLLPYGANIEGIGGASLVYFNKPARDLTLSEVMSLTLVPQNPNARANEVTSDESVASSNVKVSRMSSAKAALIKSWLARHPEDRGVNLEADLPLATRRLDALPFRAPHFVNLALERGWRADFRKRGRIDSTLDLMLQEATEKKLKSYVEAHRRIGIDNATAMIVNSETMEVVSLVGSADFFDSSIQGQVNGALGQRSPGSSLKPFAYALALDQGLIHPLSLLKDTPMSFGGFDPENFDRAFAGPVTATDALIHSRNVPAVYLSSLLKSPTLYEFLKDAGVTKLREPTQYGLSVVLGGAEITMEEMIRLYAMLANRGELKSLRYFKNERSRVLSHPISREAAFLSLEMLRKNARDDQKYTESWIRDSVPVAWKTGTSHGFRDAWTTGLVGPYVISVWLGNFNGDGNPALVGRELAAPLFFSLVDVVKNRSRAEATWLTARGLNVKKVKVCSISGKLPGKHCHHQVDTWFIPGKSPIAVCDIHRELPLTPAGLRACGDDAITARKEIFEFWPSDLLQIFRLAGIPRKTPPPFAPNCKILATQAEGIAPTIVSPRREVVYSMRVTEGRTKEQAEIVPLAAVADGDAKKLHWFIGGRYLGQSEPQKPYLWKPNPGHYVVRVVDDLGRADSRVVDVKVTR